MSHRAPTDQVFWYLPKTKLIQLNHDVQADVVIIGGGMAGLTAAQRFQEKGCSVIVIEKNFCGAGASGKSSGFITPDSEFSLSSFVKRFGPGSAKQLWEFVGGGVARIKNSIEEHDISCDYQVQDTLVVANSAAAFASEIEEEHDARKKFGYDSNLYTGLDIEIVIGSEGYSGGVRYSKTFGINGFQYLQGLKEVLRSKGVGVYEETPALSIGQGVVTTPYGTINAAHTVLCADRFIPDLGKLTYEISHVQTFLMVSAPLTDREVAAIFPDGPLMVWDTDMIYQYYRITGDNRLLLGGSTIPATYARKPEHDRAAIADKLSSYFKKKFPQVDPQFQYMWPGLIGVSKDIMPLAGRDRDLSSLYYVGAAAGLPWAAALGSYAADVLIDGRSELDEYFSPYRHFRFGHGVQNILGTRLTFALSHLTSLQSF